MATRLQVHRSDARVWDSYQWTREQAEALRAGRLDQLDVANLAAEIEALARAERSAVLNNARIVIEHLLKLQLSRAIEPRGAWRATVREHRNRLQIDLTPSLREELEAELPFVYALAVDAAKGAMGDDGDDSAADRVPDACPYTLEQVTGDWLRR